MGYGGKIDAQRRARELRARSWTLADIATELGVSKSSVSVWVRDVAFVPNPRRRARRRGPNKLQRAKAAEIERLRVEGIERVGTLTEREFLMAGLGLYAGDGAKTGGIVKFANSDPAMISFFCAWLRTFFPIDETRMRVRVYLHDDLPLAPAHTFWSEATGIPESQFHEAYRARSRPTPRTNRHVNGCCHVIYSSTPILREILGMMRALMLVPSSSDLPG